MPPNGWRYFTKLYETYKIFIIKSFENDVLSLCFSLNSLNSNDPNNLKLVFCNNKNLNELFDI